MTLFNTEVPATDQVVDTQAPVAYFDSLVGEGKKYKDVEALAKAKAEADKFIDHILQEKKEVEEELKKRLATQELVDQLTGKWAQSNIGQQQSLQQDSLVTQMNTQDVSPQPHNPEDVKELIRKTLKETQQELVANNNLNEVKTVLSNAWGKEQVSFKLKEKAKEIGVGESFLDDLAKHQPKAFLKLIGIDQPTHTQNVTSNSLSNTLNVNRSNDIQLTAQEKEFKELKALKTTNPREYVSSTTQQKLFKLAQQIGVERLSSLY